MTGNLFGPDGYNGPWNNRLLIDKIRKKHKISPYLRLYRRLRGDFMLSGG